MARFWIFFILLAVGLLFRGGGHLVAWLLVSLGILAFTVVHLIQQKRVYTLSAAHVMGFFLLALFAGLTIVSWRYSTVAAYGFEEIAWAICGLAVFVVMSEKRLSAEKLRRFFQILVVAGVVTTLIGLWLYVFGPIDRLSGLFLDPLKLYRTYPNAFATFLLALFPPAFFLFFSARGKSRIFFAAACALFVSALLLSFSRGAFFVFLVGSGVAVILFAPVFSRARHGRSLLGAVFLVLLGGVIAASFNVAKGQFMEPLSFVQKASFQANEGGSPISERAAFFRGSLALTGERPFLGYGPASFPFVYPRYQRTLLANSQHPHNLFLKIGAESGIPALVVFFSFLVLVFFVAIRGFPFLTSERREALFVCVASFTLMLLHSMIDYNLLFTTNALLFFAFAGLTVNIAGTVSTSTLPSSRHIVPVLTVVIALVFFFVAGHEAVSFPLLSAGRLYREQGDFRAAYETLQRAQRMLFPREGGQLLAETAFALFQKTNERSWLLRAVTDVERTLEHNPMMAHLHALRGDFFLAGARSFFDYEAAEQQFRKALSFDAMNDLSFHEKLFQSLVAQSKFQEASRLVPSLAAILKTYQRMLARNEHLTVLSGNPAAAIRLAQRLQQVDSGNAAEYRRLAGSLEAFRAAELSKMQRFSF